MEMSEQMEFTNLLPVREYCGHEIMRALVLVLFIDIEIFIDPC